MNDGLPNHHGLTWSYSYVFTFQGDTPLSRTLRQISLNSDQAFKEAGNEVASPTLALVHQV